ncbi:DUF6461 domain-containing protein [Streptomyces sp. NPDC059788]|uniref:DUF6461 domain-containing protein n=1 Tax=Streptomyces sp. NPDC059788 TaxID=3346948 RepID=UPI00365FF323
MKLTILNEQPAELSLSSAAATSRGAEAVVTFASSTAPSLFTHVRDGVTVAEFEIEDANEEAIKGEEPESLVAAMKDVGLLLPPGRLGRARGHRASHSGTRGESVRVPHPSRRPCALPADCEP